MTTQDTADVLRNFLRDAWNERDLDAFAKYVSPDVRFHGARGPTIGYQQYLEMATDFQRAFPDLHFDIQHVIAEGEHASVRLIISGTNDGPWRGRPPTHRKARVVGQPQVRVKDGKIVEFWQLFDELGMLHQIGHVPDHSLLGPHNTLVEDAEERRDKRDAEREFDREEHIRRAMDAGFTRTQAEKHAEFDMRGR